MKKFAIILAVAAVSAAFAGPAKAPVKVKPTTAIHCCVMPSMDVNIAEATKAHRYADVAGRRYFFCCSDCAGQFKKDPSKFKKGASIPTPKPAHH